MNYHNIGEVFNINLIPSFIYDDQELTYDYYASNSSIKAHIESLFSDKSSSEYESIEKISVYPVIYLFNEEDARLTYMLSELSSVEHFSGVVLRFETKRTSDGNRLKNSRSPIIHTGYDIFFQQSHDERYVGNEPLLISTLCVTALSYLRTFYKCPNNSLVLEINIPDFVVRDYPFQISENEESMLLNFVSLINKEDTYKTVIDRFSGSTVDYKTYTIGESPKVIEIILRAFSDTFIDLKEAEEEMFASIARKKHVSLSHSSEL